MNGRTKQKYKKNIILTESTESETNLRLGLVDGDTDDDACDIIMGVVN